MPVSPNMWDSAMDLARQLLQQRRNGWPRNLNEWDFDAVPLDLPKRIESRPVELTAPEFTEPQTNYSLPCCGCGRALQFSVAEKRFHPALLDERAVCRDCSKVEPDNRPYPGFI